jgi:hypothetical protein
MLNQILTTDKLQVITANATATIDVHVSGADVDNTTPASQVFIPFKEAMLTITGAATTDITTVNGTNHYKNIKYMSFVNTHASLTQTVQVIYNANSTTDKLTPVITLLAGESLVCREGVWFHFDTNGGVYGPSLPVASDTTAGAIQIALQADMVTGTSTVLAVTPGRQRYHPAHPKAFFSCVPAGTLQQSYGVTSVAATGTGLITATWSTAFAAATYCTLVTVEMTATTYAVANDRKPHIFSGGRATTTCEYVCHDSTATTMLVKDPTTWHVMAFGGQ